VVNAAACDVLSAAISVVVRLMIAVVVSPAICLGVSNEIEKDIGRSDARLGKRAYGDSDNLAVSD
jgi:hypothetical protein